MKRFTILLALLLSASPGMAQIGSGIFGPPGANPAQEVTVATSGGDATRICGMVIGGPAGFACGVDSNDQCVPGSAVAIAKARRAADPNSTVPITIRVMPGRYNECVAIDNTSYIDVVFEVGAELRPDVTGPGQVIGAPLRLANLTTTKHSTHHIRIFGPGTVWNDSYKASITSPLSGVGVQVGSYLNPTGDSPWNHILIQGLRVISNGTGIGVSATSSNTAKDLPVIDIISNSVTAGDLPLLLRQNMRGRVERNRFYHQPNFAETQNLASTGPIVGTMVDTGVGLSDSTAGQYYLDANAPTVDGALEGRSIMIYGGACNTGIASSAGVWGIVTQYVGAERKAFMHGPAPAPAGADFSTCTYEVVGIANSDANSPIVNSALPGATDKDWTLLRGSTTSTTTNPYMPGGVGIGGSRSSGTNPAARIELLNNTIIVDNNEGTAFHNSCAEQSSSEGFTPGGAVTFIDTTGGAPTTIIDGGSLTFRANYPGERGECSAVAGVMLQETSYAAPPVIRNLSIEVLNTNQPNLSPECVHIGGIAAGAAPVIDNVRCNISSTLQRHVGLAQAGSAAGTLVMASSASSANTTYVNSMAHMLTGTCAGQVRRVLTYTGASRTAAIHPDWNACTPAATDRYLVGAVAAYNGSPNISEWDGANTARGGRTDVAIKQSFGASNLDTPVIRDLIMESGGGYIGDRATFVDGWATIATLSQQAPLWTSNSAAWAAGDLVCSVVRPPHGVSTTGTASLNVTTLELSDSASVCLYTYDGENLLGAAESISVATTGIKTGAFADPQTGAGVALSNSASYWLCLGSNAATTLIVAGRPAATLGTGTVGRLGTGAATCPLTIAPASMSAWTTVLPEVVLTP